MKDIGHKTIVRILKWIANFALILEVIAVIVMVGIIIFTILYEDEYLDTTYPISLIEKFPDYEISSPSGKLEQLKIYTDSATIRFTMDSWGYYALRVLEILITISLMIGITLLAKKIFQSLEREHPFTLENASRLKRIAFLVLFMTPYSLIHGLIAHYFITNNLQIEGKEFADTSIYYLGVFYTGFKPNEIWVNIGVNYQALLTGAVLLIIAEIFRVGVVMKEDNESII